MVVCRMCGEAKPFDWLGGFHCSPWRASQGFHPLKGESWPNAQMILIEQQRFIEEARSAEGDD